MERQAQINQFSLAAHRLLMPRLSEHAELLDEAIGVLNRWREQAGGTSHSEVYWREWEQLLRQGVVAVAATVCTDTDHAATLRSVSPLGRFLLPEERQALLRASLAAA